MIESFFSSLSLSVSVICCVSVLLLLSLSMSLCPLFLVFLFEMNLFFLRTDYSGRATVAMEIEQSHACKAILLMDGGELWLYHGSQSLQL